MDWIDFKNNTPNDSDHIWGLLPNEETLEGYYSAYKHGKDGEYWMFHKGGYLKIIKWATWNVIY